MPGTVTLVWGIALLNNHSIYLAVIGNDPGEFTDLLRPSRAALQCI